MKIEMGESLILSWLKHAKNCQIVQTNWKPSTDSWELFNEEEIEKIVDTTQNYFMVNHELDLFKQNASFTQIIKQGEIDVLGIEFNGAGMKRIYAVDIAFHEFGLNYGDKPQTLARVIKKLIRTAITIYGYFNLNEGDIIFASPKINNAVSQEFVTLLPELKKLLNESLGLKFEYRIIANDDFRDKIISVVHTLSNSVADTSELYMRSIQLYKLFDSNKDYSDNKAVRKSKISRNNVQKLVNEDMVQGYEEIKIGALVRSTFPDLIAANKLDALEIERLQSAQYSKLTFNLNYPFLKKIEKGIPTSGQRFDSNGHARYYSKVYRIGNSDYFLCHEWFEGSKVYYIRWLKEFI